MRVEEEELKRTGEMCEDEGLIGLDKILRDLRFL